MKKTFMGLNALLVFILLLTACAPAATPEPTIDANQLFTQAAMTVIAQLTQNAPPATQTPMATLPPVATNTPLGGALPTLPPLSTLPSLSTPTKAALNIADKAAYITQSPGDNTNVTAGKVFNITWRLQNVGTTTWNQNYVYRFYAPAGTSGKIPTSANGYNLTSSVAPNGTVDLTVVATAPSSVGNYGTQWVLTNPEGVNFALFTLVVNVVAGSTGGGSEPTATGVPNDCEVTVSWTGSRNIPAGTDTVDPYEVNGGQIKITWSKVASDSVLTVKLDGGAAENYTSSPALVNRDNPGKTHHQVIIGAITGDVTLTGVYGSYANNSCPGF